MKIIFVTREGYELAGARIRAYNFARELKRRGIEAEVLSYSGDLGAKDGINEGAMKALDKIKYNIAAYKRLSKEKHAIIVIQRFNYHSFAPLLTRIIHKRHIVLDVDDWEIREDPRYILGFYPTSKAEYLTKKIASISDFCIAGSHYLKDYLEPFNKDVYYIPSCVDTDLFRPDGLGVNNDTVRFAWIGTLHRQQDVENVKFIIDCFNELRKKMKGISLDIVGDGIYSGDVLTYISDSGAKTDIDFIGWVAPDKIPHYLRSIDIGLCPLIQDTRFNMSKSPAKLLEYMAMAKSTVSSYIGEAGLIVEDGRDGFLADNRAVFIDKMEILAKNSKLREEMGRGARDKVMQGYSLKVAGDKLSSAFKNYLSK